LGKLAEGDELGSNLLRVFQSSPEGPGGLQLIYDVLKQAMPSNPLEVKKMVEKSGSGSLGLGKFSISAGLRQSVEEGRINEIVAASYRSNV
jgi:hypothetical protein